MSEAHNVASAAHESRALSVVPAHGSKRRVLPFDHLWPTIAGKDKNSARHYYGRHATLTALFNVTWDMIRHWQSGRRPMPQWARDILKSELKRQIAERQHVLDILDGR